jgi:hypothetical protein
MRHSGPGFLTGGSGLFYSCYDAPVVSKAWGIGIGAFAGSVLGGIIGYVALGPGVGLYIDIVLGAVAGANLAAGASLLRGLWPLFLCPWWLSMDEGLGLIFWAPAFYVY